MQYNGHLCYMIYMKSRAETILYNDTYHLGSTNILYVEARQRQSVETKAECGNMTL